MKIFFDTEFTGLQLRTDLISIGIIADNGAKFYAELNDYDKTKIDEWLQTNVIDNLLFSAPPEDEDEYYSMSRLKFAVNNTPIRDNCSIEMRGSMATVGDELKVWLSQFKEKIDVWSDVLAWDWVLFCELLGGGLAVGQYVNYIPFDIATLMVNKGVDPDINREKLAKFDESKAVKHNAMHDAIIIRDCYNELMKLPFIDMPGTSVDGNGNPT
jgi:hypothetical protein